MEHQYDVLIAGTGVSGLFLAMHLPANTQVLMITKANNLEDSDSFLAQGGICMLKNESDYESYFEDTMRAGHYENDPASVEVMIRSSQAIIRELVACGVDFASEADGTFNFTREGAHSTPRILHHEDCTGKEITQKLLAKVRRLPNVTICTQTTLIDLLCVDNRCCGGIVQGPDGAIQPILARDVVMATGGVGGVYHNSTNFPHLTGDGVALALRHGVAVQNVDYVQIHPTTLYSQKPGRRFLISESVRGEGAVLLDKNGKRFVDELLPRDLLSQAIRRQMQKEGTEHVWLSMQTIKGCDVRKRFPTICARCAEEGIDITKDWIPVVPAQHYFMGGVKVNLDSRTSMPHLYAVGETACNGVHGANRLASNSLLESLVFAKRAAKAIAAQKEGTAPSPAPYDPAAYANIDAWKAENIRIVRGEIDREKQQRRATS